MADYKVVDAEQLNADITQIANAIREKAGTTDAMLFPSGLVEAIANMETGGGLPAGIAKMDSGELVLTSNKIIDGYMPLEIAHNLGEAPDFFFMVCIDNTVSYDDHSDLLSMSYHLLTRANIAQSASSVELEVYSYYGANDVYPKGFHASSSIAGRRLKSEVVQISPAYTGDEYRLFLNQGNTYQWVAVKFA